MLRALFFCFCLILTLQIDYLRLQTFGQTRLDVGNSLVSTAGIFRMTLQNMNCGLNIERWTDSGYVFVGTFTSSLAMSNCNSISIDSGSGKIFTDTSMLYAKVESGGIACNVTSFLIDDIGVIRLICLSQKVGNIFSQGWQWNNTQFKTTHPYIYASSSDVITNTSVLSPVTNKAGWRLSANNGLLSMINMANTTQTVTYNYSRFSLYPGTFKDSNDSEPPKISFPNVRYEPRCGYLEYVNFKSPYLFQFDEYWPYFRVSDQTGYPIVEIMFPQIDCVRDYGLALDSEFNCRVWFCPSELFSHKGTCVSSCPNPYFHFITRNASRCVLICDQGATYNNMSRICTCGPYVAPSCPFGSTGYPGGCRCATGFYDGYACIQYCAPGYLGLDGICLSCPFKCSNCTVNNAAGPARYLTCIVCTAGYTLSPEGICKATCNGLVDHSVIGANGICIVCNDLNCQECEQPYACKRCQPIYALYINQCLLVCPSGTELSLASLGNFQCLTRATNCVNASSMTINGTAYLQCKQCLSNLYTYGEECVANCPGGTSPNPIAMACICPSGQILINKVCASMVQCPITMYLSTKLGTCLMCPFGCLVCMGGSSICITCAPGYVFFAYSPPYCGYNSPLYQCTNTYTFDFENSRCLPKVVTSANNKCLSTIGNCKMCNYESASDCLVCETGYVWFNNKCIGSCPPGTWAYNQVCLLNNPSDSRCVKHGVSANASFFLIDLGIVNSAKTYEYFVQSGYNLDGNPIGGGIYSSGNTDLGRRATHVRSAYYRCERCQTGFGVSPNGTCLPCFRGCSSCISTDRYWCLTCLPGYNLTNSRQCLGNDTGGVSCPSGQILNTNGICMDSSNCTNYYVVQWRTCWYSAPYGTTVYREPGKSYLTASWMLTEAASGQSSDTTWWNGGQTMFGGVAPARTSTYSGGGSASKQYLGFETALYNLGENNHLAYLIPDASFKYHQEIQKNPPTWVYKDPTVSPAFSQLTNATYQSDYLVTYGAKLSQTLTVDMTRSLRYMESVEQTYPANSIIGIKSGQTRPSLIKHDIAFIGYIFGVAALILAVIFVGNDVMFRMDNLLIFMQTIYFFLFVRHIIPISLAQFYYGFKYAHIGFFPNLCQPTIPIGYYEYAPIAYRLVNLDANVVRNAGFSFSILVIFIGVYLVVLLIAWLLFKLCYKPSAWRSHMLVNFLLFFFQLIMMNILFFSFTELRYGAKDDTNNPSYLTTSWGVAILFTIFYGVYTIVRLITNPIPGIYCLKRIVIVAIMACTNNNWIIVFLFLEVVFLVARWMIEKPVKGSHIATLVIEQILIMGAYALMMYLRIPNVVIILVSIFVISWFFLHLYELSRVYTDSNNEWEYAEDETEVNNSVHYEGTSRLRI